MPVEDFLRERYPDADISIYEKEEQLRLEKIVIPENRRGEGIGTRFMEDLTGYADERDKLVSLEPSPDFGATSRGRLMDFYGRFGFLKNEGPHKDFTIRDSMYRPPR